MAVWHLHFLINSQYLPSYQQHSSLTLHRLTQCGVLGYFLIFCSPIARIIHPLVLLVWCKGYSLPLNNHNRPEVREWYEYAVSCIYAYSYSVNCLYIIHLVTDLVHTAGAVFYTQADLSCDDMQIVLPLPQNHYLSIIGMKFILFKPRASHLRACFLFLLQSFIDGIGIKSCHRNKGSIIRRSIVNHIIYKDETYELKIINHQHVENFAFNLSIV